MLDIGFMELLLISIVALLVLGPEKLPQAVRTAALWIGRARRSFNKVKAEIEREIDADDIRRQLHNESILADLDEAKEKASRLTRDTKESFSQLEKDVRHGLDGEADQGKAGNDAGMTGKGSGKGSGKESDEESDEEPGEEPGESQPGDEAEADRKASDTTTPHTTTQEPAADEGDPGEADAAGSGNADTPQAERPEEAEPDTEEKKPVTDFYNNPPDKVVTVQGRKFKSGKDDDNGA